MACSNVIGNVIYRDDKLSCRFGIFFNDNFLQDFLFLGARD